MCRTFTALKGSVPYKFEDFNPGDILEIKLCANHQNNTGFAQEHGYNRVTCFRVCIKAVVAPTDYEPHFQFILILEWAPWGDDFCLGYHADQDTPRLSHWDVVNVAAQSRDFPHNYIEKIGYVS